MSNPTIHNLDDLRALLNRPGATALTIVYRAPARLNQTAKVCPACGEQSRSRKKADTCGACGAAVTFTILDNPFPGAVRRSHVNGIAGFHYDRSVTRQRLREAEVGDEVEVFVPEERAAGNRVPGTPFVEAYVLPAEIDKRQYRWSLVEIDADGIATVNRVSYRKGDDGERVGVKIEERAPFAEVTRLEYLEVLPTRVLDAETLDADGREIDPEAVRPFRPAPRKDSGSQGTDKRIEPRDYLLTRIEAVTLAGETYFVQLDDAEAEAGAA